MTRFKRIALEIGAGIALFGCAILARGETPASTKFVIHGHIQSQKLGPGPLQIFSQVTSKPVLFTTKEACETVRTSKDFTDMIERVVLTFREALKDDSITEPTECVEAADSSI